MKLISYIRMIVWGYLGIRGPGASTRELETARPVVLIAFALALAAVLGLSLWALAHFAVGTLSA